MNVKTNSSFSFKNVIPPARKTVPAGFSVYSVGDNPELFLFLESGELKATVSDFAKKEKILFRVFPGSIVGLTSLIEKEPFAYALKAEKESTFALINEESLYSVLSTLPVWLLASIRQLILKAKRTKQKIFHSSCFNLPLTFATYLLMKAEILIAVNQSLIFENAENLLKECSFLSRIPIENLEDLVKTFVRKQMIVVENGSLGIPEIRLLQVYIEYLECLEKGLEYPPFQLNLVEKRTLFALSRNTESPKEAGEWLKILQRNDKFVTVKELILLESNHILEKTDFDLLKVNEEKLQDFLISLKYESEIRGISL